MAGFEDLITQLLSDQNSLIFQYLLPFLFIVAIFMLGLEAIRAFRNRINVLLSIVLALLAVPVYPWFASLLIPLGSYSAILVFAAFFFTFIVRFAWSKGREAWFDTMGDEGKMRWLEEKLNKEYKKFNRENERGNETKAFAIHENIKLLESQREYLRRKRSLGPHA